MQLVYVLYTQTAFDLPKAKDQICILMKAEALCGLWVIVCYVRIADRARVISHDPALYVRIRFASLPGSLINYEGLSVSSSEYSWILDRSEGIVVFSSSLLFSGGADLSSRTITIDIVK